jgi:hypothetical protein
MKHLAYLKRLTLPEGFGTRINGVNLNRYDFFYYPENKEKLDKILNSDDPKVRAQAPTHNQHGKRIAYHQNDGPESYFDHVYKLEDDYFVYFNLFPTSFEIKSRASYASRGKKALSALNYEYSYSDPVEVSFTAFFINENAGRASGVDFPDNAYLDVKRKKEGLTRVEFNYGNHDSKIKSVEENIRILRGWTNPAFYDVMYLREPPYVELVSAGVNVRGRITSLKNKVTLHKNGVPTRCYSTITIRSEPHTILPRKSGKVLQFFVSALDKATFELYPQLNKLDDQGQRVFGYYTLGESKQGIVKRIVRKVRGQ